MSIQTTAYQAVPGRALAPQSVADAATVNGDAIDAKHLVGRHLRLLVAGGDLTGVTALTVTIQGQKDSDDSWEAVKDADDADLAVDLPAGSALDGGAVQFTLPIHRLGPGGTVSEDFYKAYRVVVEPVGAAALLSATYTVEDLYRHPADVTDYAARVLIPANSGQ